jgi:hypothetical protein
MKNLITHLLSASKVTFFERILAALDGKMETPTPYGWFHLLFLAIVITTCIFVIIKCKNINTKTFNRVLFAAAGTLIAFEIYKQFNFSYDSSEDSWSYHWYAFPFQFCSTPMYVMLAAAIFKEGKIKDTLCAFLGTYGLFAGIAVMLYPNDVFIETIGIDIQTMVHHGMMVVMGVFMYASGRVKIEHKSILKALPAFATLVVCAILFNELYHLYDPAKEQTFNMFFISRHYSCTLPVLSMIYPTVPYVVFLFIYLIGFTLAGYVMLLLTMGLTALAKKIQANYPNCCCKKFIAKMQNIISKKKDGENAENHE